jgi:acetylornithine deacetylase/succinyl-diaminopimelate desuccinylase-like protein
MATNFESRTVAEWNAYGVTLAAALPPADRDNFLGQWADDVASAAGRQRTETEAIKRARSYLAGMLAPTPGPLGAISGTGKALQARALFEFDKRVAAGEDPDQLAEELVQRDEKKIGAISQKEAAQNVDGAAKMLSLGQLTDEQFVAMYQNDDGVVEKIREAVRKKAITQDEARRALRALAQ